MPTALNNDVNVLIISAVNNRLLAALRVLRAFVVNIRDTQLRNIAIPAQTQNPSFLSQPPTMPAKQCVIPAKAGIHLHITTTNYASYHRQRRPSIHDCGVKLAACCPSCPSCLRGEYRGHTAINFYHSFQALRKSFIYD